jgi:Exopolysaccharide synthesis, ExoD
LLRKKIPRNSLSILVQGISALLDVTEGATRERWNWVFHPATSVALGLILFLLGVASMAPIIGGGAQHAAAAFLIAIGLAERDGLAVMIGALAGIASLAVAALSIASGRKLWKKVRTWLVQCARRLHLSVLAALLDRCCNGLGDLVRLRWGGLLLLLLTPAKPLPPREQSNVSGGGLRRRAQLALVAATRSATTLKASPA